MMRHAGQALALVVDAEEPVAVVMLGDLDFAADWAGPGTVADATSIRVVERPPPGPSALSPP